MRKIKKEQTHPPYRHPLVPMSTGGRRTSSTPSVARMSNRKMTTVRWIGVAFVLGWLAGTAPVATVETRASDTRSVTAHPARYCDTCARDAKGRILRSAAAKRAFRQRTGFPKGRLGYVVDHIVPLACGGPDDTSNMQWQTIAEARAKDRWERTGCR